MESRFNKTSKFLSLLLRHKPEAAGLTLDSEGYCDVDRLLTALKQHGHSISRADLEYIVTTNDKKRFAFSRDGDLIRASQGHSIEVDLDLQSQTPPELLFHGTAERFLGSIQQTGIKKRSRQHVHLSQDIDTAIKVGSRHGIPVVLRIEATLLHSKGRKFFKSANGVWLTDDIQPGEFAVQIRSNT